MTDPFARATAVKAHKRATQAQHDITELRQLLPPRPLMFRNTCCLCGWPTKKDARYCQAHQWAA